MSEQDIIETQVVDNDEYPQIPYADTENPGIASFNHDDFVVGENGHISATQKSGIPQYLGKIVGSGQGVSSLNWKLDSGSIKPTEQVKIGDYVMLTDAYLNFKPGDIFRITFVQVKGSVYTVKTSNTKLTSLGTIVGGKLYLHYILKSTGDIPVYFSLWSSSVDKLTTVDKLFEYYQVPQYQNRLIPCSCGGVSTNKIGVLILDYTTGMSKTATITYTDSVGVKTETISENLTDVVIEV